MVIDGIERQEHLRRWAEGFQPFVCEGCGHSRYLHPDKLPSSYVHRHCAVLYCECAGYTTERTDAA